MLVFSGTFSAPSLNDLAEEVLTCVKCTTAKNDLGRIAGVFVFVCLEHIS